MHLFFVVCAVRGEPVYQRLCQAVDRVDYLEKEMWRIGNHGTGEYEHFSMEFALRLCKSLINMPALTLRLSSERTIQNR